MILIKDNLELVRRWCNEHRDDVGSTQPYFIEQEHAEGWLLPEDSLIEQAIADTGTSYQYLIVHRGIEVVIDPIVIVSGCYYRRTGEIDENGNYYLEHAESVTLSDGVVMDSSNKDVYDGTDGWHWYDDGDVVSIATPTAWERIKNWFS